MDAPDPTSDLAATLANGPAGTAYADVLAQTGWVRHRDAMQTLGLSRSTLQRLRSDGRIRFAKLGRRIYYRLVDIDALLAGAVVDVL